MLFTNTLTYGVLAALGLFSLISAISDGKNIFLIIILNVIIGGAMYIIFNALGVQVNLNYITGVFIGALGMPGVILVVIIKVLFGVAL